MLAIASGFALYYLASRWRFSFPNETRYRLVWGAVAAVVLVGSRFGPGWGLSTGRLVAFVLQGVTRPKVRVTLRHRWI